MRYTEKVKLEGNAYKPELTCADNASAGQLLGLVSSNTGEYASDGDVLMLIVPTWTPRDGHVAFRYRRVIL
jgi:hypothetical protein